MKHFRTLLLGMLVMALLAGCNRRPSAPRLQLFIVSDYVPQEVIDGFTKETGIGVDTELFSTNEQMLIKLASSPGHYDVIQPSEYVVEHLIKENRLEPLEAAKIPNIANILPEFRTAAHDPGLKYSVPYMSGTVGIVVNTQAIKDPIRGYRDVFQEKYKGKILVVDDAREMVSWAMEANGIPINDMTPENLAKVKPTLGQWLKLVTIYSSDDPKPQLFSGDANIGVVYSGDAAKLWQQDKKFQYVLPAEGAHRFIDSLCIPKGAPHKEEAEKFLNYILRPDVSKAISDKYPYTNPNGAARKLLSKEQLENPASYPPETVKLEIFHDIGKASSDVSAMVSEMRGKQ